MRPACLEPVEIIRVLSKNMAALIDEETDDQPDGQTHDYEWLQNQLAAAGLESEGALAGGQYSAEAEWEDPSVDGLLTSIFQLCEAGCGNPATALVDLISRLSIAGPSADGSMEVNHSTVVPYSINTPGPDGDSALHLAALYGHLPCVKALLAAGALPGIVNLADGSTVLHDAAAGGYTDIADLILAGEQRPVPCTHATVVTACAVSIGAMTIGLTPPYS